MYQKPSNLAFTAGVYLECDLLEQLDRLPMHRSLAVHKALEEYLRSEAFPEPNLPSMRTVGISLDPEQAMQLKKLGGSRSSHIREAIRRFLARNDNPEE